ncbi:DNA replication/repair protein RecF [Candidatus Saccharibacteria bacterium]|nr:DNA replication/repair protein RecF [Candidatus Saccharibacteria bacterium]MBR6122973.1 DNA replication/repair protein RecF [Candidatus Saccharibacteria bacterium]
MIIKGCKLTNFRSHEFFELKCWKETTMISGENGGGKTSILEAIYECLRGKSFRAVDREILRRGAEFYRVELEYMNGEKVVVVYERDGKKSFLVGDKKTARLPKKYRYPVVLFEPDDLNLVSSSPSHKREYFDRSFGQLSDGYSASLTKYNKALKQRNELLKSEYVSVDAVFSWNVMLSRLGVEIWKYREEQVKKINERLTEVYRSIAENEDEVEIVLRRDAEVMSESGYLKELEKGFERDRVLGYTSFGVHRDNYEFRFNGTEASGSASRGEVRSIVVALKFIEADVILAATGKAPVVLLDDVFSELDETRQKALVYNFKKNQVIITSVNAVEDIETS